MPYNDTDLRILVTFSEEMVFGFIEEILGQRIFPVGMMGKALAHIKHIE